MSENNISINILDKSYQIKCPNDKVHELRDAAAYVDKKMREVRDSGKVVGLDRVAIIAALNVAHELFSIEKKENEHLEEMSTRIRDMQKRIIETMTIKEQEEL